MADFQEQTFTFGIFDQEDTIFLDAVNGDDRRSGRVSTESVKTWGRVNQVMSPGVTVQIAEGTYNEKFVAPWPSVSHLPVTILTEERVVFQNSDSLSQGARFIGTKYWDVFGVKVLNSDKGWFLEDCENCRFVGIEGADFRQEGVLLDGGDNVELSGFLFESEEDGAVVFPTFSGGVATTTQGGFPVTNIFDGTSAEWRSSTVADHTVSLTYDLLVPKRGRPKIIWGSNIPRDFRVKVFSGAIELIALSVVDNEESDYDIPYRLTEFNQVVPTTLEILLTSPETGATYYSIQEVEIRERPVGVDIEDLVNSTIEDGSIKVTKGVGFNVEAGTCRLEKVSVEAEMIGYLRTNLSSSWLEVTRLRGLATKEGLMIDVQSIDALTHVSSIIIALRGDVALQEGGEGSAVYAMGTGGQYEIYHNVFYDFVRGLWIEEHDLAVGNVVTNVINGNIFVQDIAGQTFVAWDDAVDVDFDRNCYHRFEGASASTILFATGLLIGGSTTDYASLADWIAAEDKDVFSIDANPLFLRESSFRDISVSFGTDLGRVSDDSPVLQAGERLLVVESIAGGFNQAYNFIEDSLKGLPLLEESQQMVVTQISSTAIPVNNS